MDLNILVIAAGWEQEPLLTKIFSLTKVNVFAIHYNESYLAFPFKKVLICDLRNINQILNFAKENYINVVISDQDDYGHLAQSFVANSLKIAGPNFHTAQISTNKYIQRLRCRETGIKHPKFSLIKSLEDLKEFSKNSAYPIIIKPVDNRGSIGVLKITKENELEESFYQSIVNSPSLMCIAEEFIVGTEITVDGYCFSNEPRSLGIATKGKINDLLQVSFDIKYPAELSKELYKKALEVNESVINKLGYSFGITHAEYIITEMGDIYLVEAANRGGGCFTSQIIMPAYSGIDILAKYINDCFNNEVTEEVETIPKEVILKFLNFKPGIIENINGIEKISNNRHLLKSRFNVQKGDEIFETSDDSNRHGFVIVSKEKKVREEADSIINTINVKYK